MITSLLAAFIAFSTPSTEKLASYLPEGEHFGTNPSGECIVSASYRPGPSDFTQVSISDHSCEVLSNCHTVKLREAVVGGGGCSRLVSASRYEVHYTNGPFGAPGFCVNYRGGVRILVYGPKRKVELLDGQGVLKSSCWIE